MCLNGVTCPRTVVSVSYYYKNPATLSVFVWYKADIVIMSSKCNLFSPAIAEILLTWQQSLLKFLLTLSVLYAITMVIIIFAVLLLVRVWCLTRFSTIVQLYSCDQFYWWRKPEWQKKCVVVRNLK